MANNAKGLGKGLAALLGDNVMDTSEEKSSLYLPISQVESCASQPRKQFDPDALADLADSIREHGIIQPLTVRKLQSGYYQIIAGERRWRAARMAGLDQVPAIVIEADGRPYRVPGASLCFRHSHHSAPAGRCRCCARCVPGRKSRAF